MTKQCIALVVQCAPKHSSSVSAFRLAQIIVASTEATLSRVFFYGDGAYHALQSILDWPSLRVDLGVCIASLQQRDDKATVSDAFTIVGLGYLAELYQTNDKVIVLG